MANIREIRAHPSNTVLLQASKNDAENPTPSLATGQNSVLKNLPQRGMAKEDSSNLAGL